MDLTPGRCARVGIQPNAKVDNDMVNEGRAKSSVDALAVMGVGGIVFGFYRWAVTQPDQVHGLMILITLALLLGILGTLYHGWLKRIVGIRPTDFVVAGKTGIYLAQHGALPAQPLAWEVVSEVILARKFKIIYPEGQVACRHVVVIFLKSGRDDIKSTFFQIPTGMPESGAGRRYLSADFPDGDWRTFESALYEFAPKGVNVRVCSKAVFDRKAGVDVIRT